jgi:hypothetical protein
VLPLPLLPLLLLLLLRKWGFAASLFCVFVVDGLGFVQLCVGDYRNQPLLHGMQISCQV